MPRQALKAGKFLLDIERARMLGNKPSLYFFQGVNRIAALFRFGALFRLELIGSRSNKWYSMLPSFTSGLLISHRLTGL